MLYRVEDKESGNVVYVKCSSYSLFDFEKDFEETDLLTFVRLDETKWPYNEVVPDIDLTTGSIDNLFWLLNFLYGGCK